MPSVFVSTLPRIVPIFPVRDLRASLAHYRRLDPFVVGHIPALRPVIARALAILILAIANINVWNRLNAATRQVAAGSW